MFLVPAESERGETLATSSKGLGAKAPWLSLQGVCCCIKHDNAAALHALTFNLNLKRQMHPPFNGGFLNNA